MKKPNVLVLEPTNSCNLNCPYCLVGLQNSGKTNHSSLARKLGKIDYELFEKIIADAREFGIQKIQLHFQGEPFLHPRIIDMIRYCKVQNFECQLFTNGLALTEEKIEALSSIPINMIRFSIDGATPETYKINRVGGDLNKVLQNMYQLMQKKHPFTRVEWQFIPLRNNEHEIPLAAQIAASMGVFFFTKPYAPTIEELQPLNPNLRRKYKQKPCTDIYYQTCVYWNGDVVPCCFDVDGKEIMGNLNEKSLQEIWENEKYQKFRKKVDLIEDSDIETCQSCLRWK